MRRGEPTVPFNQARVHMKNFKKKKGVEGG